MAISLTPKFQMALVDEGDFYNYTDQFRANFQKLDSAVKDSGSNVITAVSTADTPVTVKGASAQAGALIKAQNSAGTEMWRVNKSGVAGPPGTWTSFNPQFTNTSGITITGVTHVARYRMLDEATMAIRISSYVSLSSPNLGSIGSLSYRLPPGYESPPSDPTEQWLNAKLWYDPSNIVMLGGAHIIHDVPTRIQPWFNKEFFNAAGASNYNNVEMLQVGGGSNNRPIDAPLQGGGNLHVSGIIEVVAA